MGLKKDDFLVFAVPRTPASDAPLDRTPGSRRKPRMSAQHFLENGDRPKPRRGLEQRDDLGIEYIRKRVRPPAFSRLTPL
jgi:hypothetical protein